MIRHILDTLRSMESDKRINPIFIISFLVFVSVARTIMEMILGSYEYIVYISTSNFVQVFSFYGLALLLYSFFLSTFAGKKPSRMARVLTPFLAVALLVPIIDYFVTGYPVVYQMSSVFNFDILRISGNNPIGESIILWLIPVLSAVYVFLERKSVKRSLLAFIVIFFVPFFLSTTIADSIGLGSSLFYLYATVASVILMLLMFYMQDSKKFGCLFNRFYERMNRVVLYIIVFVFGIATTGSIFGLGLFGIYIIILLLISFVAMCMNDYFDFQIDKVNKKNNILSLLNREELKNVIIISFIVLMPFLVFVFEGIGNVVFVYYMIAILSLVILYSYKNLLKGLFPLNYIADALSYGLMFMAGRSLFLAQWQFGMIYLALVTIIFILLVPIKDCGDFKGDKKFGIKNLYTVFGFEKGLKLSKIFLVMAFIVFMVTVLSITPAEWPMEFMAFYLIPTLIFIPIVVIRFRKGESIESLIWIINVLLVIYLVPFLL